MTCVSLIHRSRSLPGFKQLKVVRGQRATTAFAEFSDVASAMAVHQQLQGATVPSSDRGGIRWGLGGGVCII